MKINEKGDITTKTAEIQKKVGGGGNTMNNHMTINLAT